MGIKSIKGADILVKFIDEKYIDSTLNNGFFFNTLDTFKQSDGLTDEQYDSDEGSHVDFNIPENIMILDKDFKKVCDINQKDVINSKYKFSYDFALKIPICCFALLKFPHDFSFVKVSNKIYEFKIKDKVIDKLNGISGNRPYICCLQQDMIKQLNVEIKNGRKIDAGKVQYYKSKGINFSKDDVKMNPSKIVFMKNEKFKNQKEFRIMLADKRECVFLKLPSLGLKVYKDKDLNNFRMYINKKYDDNHIALALSHKDEELSFNEINLKNYI